MSTSSWRSRLTPAAGWVSWAPALWCAVMSAVVVAPVAWSLTLTHDMVFVPHQPFKARWLGLDGSVPRAVPSDAVVSMLTQLVPGWVVQPLVLFLVLYVAGLGAAWLVWSAGPIPALCAATLYTWNAFVFERLDIGQWALLVGYAALPWVVTCANRVRVDVSDRAAWCRLTLWLGVAALGSPSGGVLTGFVALCLLVGRDRIRSGCALAAVAVVNLPWLVPSLLYRGGIPGTGSGVAVFAARADTPFGVLGSLLSFGGIWNSDVVPPGRDSLVLGGAALGLAVVGLVGFRWATDVDRSLPVARLSGATACLFVVALLPAMSWGRGLMQSLDADVPGAGILRDSQKWVAPLALVAAVGLAVVVAKVLEQQDRFGRQALWWGLALGVLVPVATLPALAWGLAGRLQPVSFPADWSRASYVVAQQEGRLASPGRPDPGVAVLPWSTYRLFPWNHDQPVLDPAPRFFPGDIVVDDDLAVGAAVVPGEDAQSAAIAAVLHSGGDVSAGLRDAGISMVIVEKGTPGIGVHAHLTGRRVFDSRTIAVWVLGRSEPGPAGPGVARQSAIVAGDLAAATSIVGAGGLLAAARLRRVAERTRHRYTRR